MKIIFLDIDGVLNHQLFYEEKSQNQRYKEIGHPLCDLDPKAVGYLNTLIEDTGAQVVISSTWRKGKTVQAMQELLEKVGFKGKVIGLTPVLYWSGDCKTYHSAPRGCEIVEWMHRFSESKNDFIERYVILDDDSDMLWHQRNSFILIDGYCGLTPTQVYRATRILNE